MTFAVGTRLGPYEIQSLLGKGGMGEVYAARDIRLDRQVAIKTVRAQGEWDTEALKRFQREARAIAALNHPNICVLHDIGNYEGTDYIVMEYLEGRTLEERLRKGPMPVSDMIKVGTEMADALNKAHQHGIIHRDIKPSNVMLTRSGAKLFDFGVAELVGADFSRTFPVNSETVPSSNRIAKFAGTVKYAAPEQFRGGPIDARTDIFSFGVLMYEMAAGLAPFQSPTYSGLVTTILTEDPPPLSEIRPDLPPALDHLISVCLKKDPADRWQNIQDIAQQLPWLERNAGAARRRAARRNI